MTEAPFTRESRLLRLSSSDPEPAASLESQSHTEHSSAKQEILNQFPTKDREIQADSYECSICLDAIQADAQIRGLSCGHAFHVICVDKWLLERSACCPVCESALVFTGA